MQSNTNPLSTNTAVIGFYLQVPSPKWVLTFSGLAFQTQLLWGSRSDSYVSRRSSTVEFANLHVKWAMWRSPSDPSSSPFIPKTFQLFSSWSQCHYTAAHLHFRPSGVTHSGALGDVACVRVFIWWLMPNAECQGWGWGDNCSDAGRRRRCLHPWLFPSCLMCLSPSFSQLFLPFTFLALLSGSLSSSKETQGVLSFRAHRGGKISRFSISFHFQVRCIRSRINNQVQPWTRFSSGICRKMYRAVFICAALLHAAAYCLFCHNPLFFCCIFNFLWGRSVSMEEQNL